MGFGDKGAGGGGPQPPTGVYSLFCNGTEDYEGDYGPSLKWLFDVFDAETGEPAIDPESGDQYQISPLTGAGRGWNKSANQWAKSIQYAAALMGRDIDEVAELSGRDIDEGITEAWATGVITLKDNGYADLAELHPYGTEVQITKVTPKAGKAAPKGKAGPPGKAAPKRPPTAPDPDDLPF